MGDKNLTRDATRRMVEMMDESQSAGSRALDSMHDQKEKLGQVEEHLDNINDNLTTVESDFDNLNKFCGCCLFPCQTSAVKNVNNIILSICPSRDNCPTHPLYYS